MKNNINFDPTVEKPILNECVRFSHDMLVRFWPEISRVRDECGDKIKVGLSFDIDCSGTSPQVKASMRFNKKYECKVESTVDLAQEDFPFLKAL